jgi:diguanylate cyclase (GGDEF)-like protein
MVHLKDSGTRVASASTTSQTNNPLIGQLTPAVPTDTSGILLRMLMMSEEARRQQTQSAERQTIPRGIMAMLLRAMKMRDPGIILHSQRLAAISSGIARLLGWTDEQRRQLEIAALLHDLGKLGVPEHILRKPGKLSSEEYDFLMLHHFAACNLLQAFQTEPAVVSMLTMLHHSFDGSASHGDEASMAQELPLGARILAVADAYDSLSSPKCYRRGMVHVEAMGVLEEKSGSRYDGNVVRTLNRWFEAEGDQLFQHVEAVSGGNGHQELTEEQSNEIVVLTQMIAVLYQFQQLYDGYFLLDANENYCIWSDGMPGMTGMQLQHTLGRTWQPHDVQLIPMTDNQATPEQRDDTVIGQVFKNGRSQFGNRLCRAGESRHFKVDVYTLPIPGQANQIRGVVQLLRNKSGVRRQSREYVELKLAATRDPLTGVANRGQLETQLRHLLEDFHSHEGTRQLSIMFLDVDHFKKINDTYGHQTGDQVLVDLTRLLQNETYSGEFIGRYGGEEFVLLCPDTDLESAVRRAERLRHAILSSSVGGVTSLTVTSSFGVATATLGDSTQTLLERADTSLYRAKETGRNRTCWDGQETDQQFDLECNDEEHGHFHVSNGSYQFADVAEVSTSLELTAMKLKAFLRESEADIQEQDHGTMRFRFGTLGFTRRWGRTPDRQPIEVNLKFETIRTTAQNDGHAKTVRQVSITVVPLGKPPEIEVFAERCRVLMREMRAYLLGS